jgi:hypothetical protein
LFCFSVIMTHLKNPSLPGLIQRSSPPIKKCGLDAHAKYGKRVCSVRINVAPAGNAAGSPITRGVIGAMRGTIYLLEGRAAARAISEVACLSLAT